uniref:SAM-dependent methyltransferase RsmB-F/NOP2-type catalytic core domain-containing protein n=1 Tax=Cyprinus carpio TaxID=7962 RepID=A0A8C2EXI2_CYPCA
MVRKSGVARRSSKRGSQISALKHLSLLDPAPAEPPLLQTGSEESPVCPDRVYLHAAAIFQSTHLEKPPAHRLISYGKRSEVRLPVAKDEASQRSAYQLAFNTLKCKCESCLLEKLLHRKSQVHYRKKHVKSVFRTKLVASLARCRIKHELLTLENMVPEQIRHREERATLLPLYGWINSLRSSQKFGISKTYSLESLDVSDVRLQKISVVFLMPACSLSAISNPVDYIMQENRDPRLMLDLSQGSVSPEKIQMLVCQQRKVLQRAVQFSQVGAVLYSTCSVHPEENEEVLKTVLSQTQENHSTALTAFFYIYMFCICPMCLSKVPPQNRYNSVSDDFRLSFFSLSPAQPEPEVIETPQEVLARAAAKGLLDGLHPNQPIQKEGRGRRSRRAPANQKRSVKTRPHATQSDQSRVAEFLDREMKGSRSEPTLSQSAVSPGQAPPPALSLSPRQAPPPALPLSPRQAPPPALPLSPRQALPPALPLSPGQAPPQAPKCFDRRPSRFLLFCCQAMIFFLRGGATPLQPDQAPPTHTCSGVTRHQLSLEAKRRSD